MKKDNVFTKVEFRSSIPRIKQSHEQLDEEKKSMFELKKEDTILDVEQDEYAISKENDILYTYGIEPCCGLVLYDDNMRALFHLDSIVTPKEVIKITNKMGLKQDATIMIIPRSYMWRRRKF